MFGLAMFVCMLGAAMANAATGLTAKLDSHLAAFKAIEAPRPYVAPKVRVAALEGAYQQWFAPLQNQADVHRTSDAELEWLFQAANIAAYWSLSDDYLSDMAMDLGGLEDRNRASTQDREYMFHALLMLRKFSEARALLDQHQGMQVPNVPRVENKVADTVHGHTVLAVEPGKPILTHQAAQLNPGIQIIVVGHPLCHFTQNAARALEHDPELLRVFKRHALWLAPQQGYLHVKAFQRWNREHPGERMVMAWKESEWPQIDTWATPTIYFFDDGELVYKIVGWPGQGNLDVLTAAARRLGLVH